MKTRTELLMQALGYQGGTVHQICAEVGIGVDEFLYTEVHPSDKMMGDHWFMGTCFNTCSMEHRKLVLLPKYKGNLYFWLGVCRSMELVNNGVCTDHANMFHVEQGS